MSANIPNPVFSINQLIGYFRIYRKYVGRRLILVFALGLLAVLVEAFGITLVLPLIASLELETGKAVEDLTGMAAWIQGLVQSLGVEGSPVKIIMCIGLLVGVKGVIRFSADAYGAILTAQLEREVKRKMFEAYAHMDFRFYSARNTGHFVNIITSQIPRLILSFGAFKTFVVSILTTTGYLTVAFLVDWRFALMAVVFGGLVLIAFRKLNDYVRTLSRQAATEASALNKFLVQCLQSYKYVASTNTMAPLAGNVFRSIHRLTRYARNQGLAGAFTGAAREPVSIITILLVLVVLLHFFEASIAAILVSLILLYRAMGQIMLLQGTWQQMMNQVGSLEIVEEEFRQVGRAQEKTGAKKAPVLSRGINLEGVGFRYAEPLDEVLAGIDLEIPARTTVALVGPSGAGKSTLVDLLTLLLRPTVGRITIDGASADEIDLPSWRRQIGYVSQDTIVFDDTVANNIGMWTGEFETDQKFTEKVIAAAEKASARQFIEALPDGFDTVVGDRGIRLSGGQKQRLFIARELFKEPRLLILDEATSALDSESERAIQRSIDKLKGETTIVIIAHRLSTVKNADQVCVLENGGIVEQGSYRELVDRKNSRFSKMVAAQVL